MHYLVVSFPAIVMDNFCCVLYERRTVCSPIIEKEAAQGLPHKATTRNHESDCDCLDDLNLPHPRHLQSLQTLHPRHGSKLGYCDV